MRTEHRLPVCVPFRLDLTVTVLRRLSSNIVDILTADGEYVRALNGARKPLIVRVSQEAPDALRVTLDGDAADHLPGLARVQRILGVDHDLEHFYQAAARIPWLGPVAKRMLGVKPPRYPTLWEACVNAVVFQQISLVAASAILRRIILAFGSSYMSKAMRLQTFPSAEQFLAAGDRDLRTVGLSVGKVATLRRVAEAILSGTLAAEMLNERPSSESALMLAKIKGIGPWTATLILLRGLGRLDVFPLNDSGVARSLAFVGDGAGASVDEALQTLGPQRGMLYYHLLLARLEAQGEIGRPSVSG